MATLPAGTLAVPVSAGLLWWGLLAPASRAERIAALAANALRRARARPVDAHHFRTRRGRGVSKAAKRRRHRAKYRECRVWQPAPHDDHVDSCTVAWALLRAS